MGPIGSSLELCFSLELHRDVNTMILFFFLSSPTSLAETDRHDRQTDRRARVQNIKFLSKLKDSVL